LQWAEAVTACKVPDEIYAQVARHFTEEELIDLTMIVTLINTWNQLNISFPKEKIGTYKAGQLG
jgi:alkylhydroperoxidase family enzyme